MSRRALERRLQAGGTSAAKILRIRRVENAEALMQLRPRLSAREIALRSGFASPATMRRAVAAESQKEGERFRSF
ncbi:helix-turn-helix domain-containing protein [Pseudoclavibacter sp. RFBJ3]|uniref:helix-turn-helix domain-containing protein n=1 Tax=unclassified Pseudoclavibacter TaxID=2615177 RepID=UPI0035BE5736